jgi:ATP-dependent DNA ligase
MTRRREAIKARFIEPMLALAAQRLPEGLDWQYELKLDGYRALAIKSGGRVQLRSRRNNDFSGRYPTIAGRSPPFRMRRCSMAR